MEEGVARSRADRHMGRRRGTASSGRRPDRVALWAVFMGVFAALAAAASAQAAGSGGVGDGTAPPPATSDGTGAPTVPGECPTIELGLRPLQLGDCGTDVQTLNLLLKSKPIGTAVTIDDQFGAATEQAVKAFQDSVGLSSDGIVESGTRKALKKGMTKSMAS